MWLRNFKSKLIFTNFRRHFNMKFHIRFGLRNFDTKFNKVDTVKWWYSWIDIKLSYRINCEIIFQNLLIQNHATIFRSESVDFSRKFYRFSTNSNKRLFSFASGNNGHPPWKWAWSRWNKISKLNYVISSILHV